MAFHTIPQAGEFGNNTWEKESWRYTGAANPWGLISADPELGYVYVPTGTPTNDYYGGHRPGANLFTDCVVSLDLNTGKRYWYFQSIHHDMWDWDFPSPPMQSVQGQSAPPSSQNRRSRMSSTGHRRAESSQSRNGRRQAVPFRVVVLTDAAMPPRDRRRSIDRVSPRTTSSTSPELRKEAREILDTYACGPLFAPRRSRAMAKMARF
jgi:quinoprotein glucose dehydrogenase